MPNEASAAMGKLTVQTMHTLGRFAQLGPMPYGRAFLTPRCCSGSVGSSTQNDPQIVGVREGDVLAGKYRIEKILGAGAMGVVVAAHHIQIDEKVAIKFLLPDALSNEEAVARFAREARAAVKIKSEHVARVSDVGTLENGAPYMVVEFLEGGDLSSWLRQRGALPIEQATEFMLQACEAMADSHGLGIVHWDLKPANLFCIRRSDGLLSIKVLDFGISKVTRNKRRKQPGARRNLVTTGVRPV